ncbi:hypothetical protein [Deinococcus ruber]|uniref:Uncharacterized protein n=1 Tax=Deinococcus ruber TaxID=1848197 RepID=A0A918BX76_9DEIO|nr:hypothetical protein [Deinococcus ruber]GGQ96799.1 hypothetical protein GCM10008957_06340 [Deinococcus ruber]
MNSQTGRGLWFWFALLYIGVIVALCLHLLLAAHRPLHVALALLATGCCAASGWLAWSATRLPRKESDVLLGFILFPVAIVPAQTGRALATVTEKLELGGHLDTFDLYGAPFMALLCLFVLLSWKRLSTRKR